MVVMMMVVVGVVAAAGMGLALVVVVLASAVVVVVTVVVVSAATTSQLRSLWLQHRSCVGAVWLAPGHDGNSDFHVFVEMRRGDTALSEIPLLPGAAGGCGRVSTWPKERRAD